MHNTTPSTPVCEPPFWDGQLHHVPWALDVLAKAADIREEILRFIPQFRPFMPYPKYANLYNNTWDAFPLSIFEGEHIECESFGPSIGRPHRGWTPDYLRIHLCLVDDPGCRITVGSETRTWKTGQFLAFKDGGPHLHSVVHEGKHERIVLSYDLNLQYLGQFIPELAPSESAASPGADRETPRAAGA